MAVPQGRAGALAIADFAVASRLGGCETFADGVLRQLGDTVDIEFVHDAQTVGFDGLGTDVQPQGDLLGGSALREQLQHLTFPLRQERKRRRLDQSRV